MLHFETNLGFERKERSNMARKKKAAKKATKKRRGSKLAGQYMGLLRGLTLKEKAQVKKLRANQGLTKAVAKARKLRSKKK